MHPDKLVEIVDGVIFAKTGRHLNVAETIVLKGAWLGQTYEHIAENSQYSLATIRNSVGHDLWKLLSKALGEKVSKTNFRVVLERIGLTSENFSGPQEGSGDSPKPQELPVDTALQPPEDQKAIAIAPQSDGGDVREAPDGSVFFTRDRELQILVEKLSGTQKDLSELIGLYGGNSLALELLAQNLREARKLPQTMYEFIVENTSRIGSILKTILRVKYPDNFSNLASDILDFLADKSKPVSPQKIQSNLLFVESNSEFREAIEKLEDKGLIEKNTQAAETTYSLHSAIRQEITNKLIAKISNEIGQRKYLEREFNSAKFYFEQSIKFNQDLAAAHYNLGSTYEKLEDMSAARNSYEKAKKYQNRAAHAAINNLARLEILEGKSDVAIELIEAILALVKDSGVKASLHKNIGWAYFEQNRYNEAKHHLQESLSLNSDYVPAHCLLAKVQSALGEKEEALGSWKNCLEKEETSEPCKNYLESEFSDKLSEEANSKLLEVVWKLEARRALNAKHI